MEAKSKQTLALLDVVRALDKGFAANSSLQDWAGADELQKLDGDAKDNFRVLHSLSQNRLWSRLSQVSWLRMSKSSTIVLPRGNENRLAWAKGRLLTKLEALRPWIGGHWTGGAPVEADANGLVNILMGKAQDVAKPTDLVAATGAVEQEPSHRGISWMQMKLIFEGHCVFDV